MNSSVQNTLKASLPSSPMLWPALMSALLLVTSIGCSQSVDEVGITGHKSPPAVISEPRNLIINRDLSGTNSTPPISPSTVLSDHSTGGNALRTSSSSPSFRMLSGVGIE